MVEFVSVLETTEEALLESTLDSKDEVLTRTHFQSNWLIESETLEKRKEMLRMLEFLRGPMGSVRRMRQRRLER
jgi:hypothetical protein